MRRVLAWAVVCLSTLALAATAPSDDPLLPDQWHLPHVGAFDAWASSQGEGVVVAVVDTGVDGTHPDLAGRVTAGVDLVERGTPPDDPNGHGTLVAGVVAAVAGNGVGGAGVAPATVVMPVRVLDASGTGSSDHVAEGIRYATRNGADVINLSLAEAPGLLRGTGSIIGGDVEDAIREAHGSGVVVVAASGNEGRGTTPYGASVPAIVVGATNRADGVWPHSNRDERTLFAPGVEILSTYTQHGYARADGTSFATPVVAAGAAMLRAAGLSPDQVRQRLLSTAHPIGTGAGRVDLAAAAGAVVASAPAPPPAPPPTPEPTPAPPPPAPAELPQPEPVTLTPPEPPAAPSPSPEPVATTPPRTPSPPADEAVAFDLRGGDRGDGVPASAPIVPVTAAAVLLLANLAGHAAWANRRREEPLFVWRLPRT